MSIDNILETTWCRDNDFGAFAKVELLFLNRTLRYQNHIRQVQRRETGNYGPLQQ